MCCNVSQYPCHQVNIPVIKSISMSSSQYPCHQVNIYVIKSISMSLSQYPCHQVNIHVIKSLSMSSSQYLCHQVNQYPRYTLKMCAGIIGHVRYHLRNYVERYGITCTPGIRELMNCAATSALGLPMSLGLGNNRNST